MNHPKCVDTIEQQNYKSVRTICENETPKVCVHYPFMGNPKSISTIRQ